MKDAKNKIKAKLDIIKWETKETVIYTPVGLDIPEDRFTKLFGYIPKNSVTIKKEKFKNIEDGINFFSKNGFITFKNEINPYSDTYENTIEWINLEKKIHVSYKRDQYGGGYDTTILFSNLKKNHKVISSMIDTFFDELFLVEEIEEVTNRFFMVAQSQQGLYNLDVEFKEIPIKDDRYDLYYGKDFPYEKLKKFVTEETENLLLLHGDPGTGKSNFFKHLIINSTRPVLYIPPTMLSVLSTPSFISYTMQNKKSIVVIEDSEEVISKNRNSATNNLLGLTDGFLKDVLDLKIICTFNCNITDIDEALLRKGRLYYEYKFDKLSVEEASELSDYLELEANIVDPVTLAELFNLEKKTSNKNSFERRTIGFGA